MPTWDILICSIVHRGAMLSELLEELDRQLHSHIPGAGGYRPGVGVICYRDNLEQPYGLKIGAMQAASQADYVSCVDDDDWVAPDFIERISEVTDIFEHERDFRKISERVSSEGGVADVSGYTDYGRVWLEFGEEIAEDLGPRSTVIVLGDARTNGRR